MMCALCMIVTPTPNPLPYTYLHKIKKLIYMNIHIVTVGTEAHIKEKGERTEVRDKPKTEKDKEEQNGIVMEHVIDSNRE